MLNFDQIVSLVDDAAKAEKIAAIKTDPDMGLSQGFRVMEPKQRMAPRFAQRTVQPAPTQGQEQVAPQPEAPVYPSFLDQLNAYRQQQSAEWEAREKSNRARSAMTGLTDGLSALANLIGTTKGASNQPRESVFPFLQQNIEQQRAQDRAIAERLRQSEMSYQQMLDRYAAQGDLVDSRLEAEKERTARALGVQGMRNEQAERNNASKEAIATGRNENRIKLKEMDLKYKGDRDKMQDYFKQQGISISREKLDEMIRHNQSMEVINEKKGSGGGNVGGYKVVITRDEYGREVSRERIPTTSGESIEWDDKEDDNKIDW